MHGACMPVTSLKTSRIACIFNEIAASFEDFSETESKSSQKKTITVVTVSNIYIMQAANIVIIIACSVHVSMLRQ